MAAQKDPVCGMDVEERVALWKSKQNGQIYLFCSKECKSQFDQQPEKYSHEQQPT
jgi:YHS domain-containing protein